MIPGDGDALLVVDQLGGRCQHAELEHIAPAEPAHRLDLDDPELIQRKCPCLVGRDHACRPERLHRREPSHDRAASRHRARTLSECNRDGGGESLGDSRDRDGDADEEGFVQRGAS